MLVSGSVIGAEHPLHDTALGELLAPESSEHVEALGAVMHAVGGDMGEDAAHGEGVAFVVAFSGDDGIERATERGTLKVVGDGILEGADFGEGVLFFFQAWAGFGFVEDIGPAAHGAEVMDEVVGD